MQKPILTLIYSLSLIVCISHPMAMEAFHTQKMDKQTQALPQLESAFNSQVEEITTINNNTPVNWSISGINLEINNQWHFLISSKEEIYIGKISVAINGVTVVNPVNLTLKPFKKTKYIFMTQNVTQDSEHSTTQNLEAEVDNLIRGYKLLGIVPNISGNDYLGYQDYVYKIAQITLYWNDKNSSNQSTTNYMLVYAK
jgi:hypothetical protein